MVRNVLIAAALVVGATLAMIAPSRAQGAAPPPDGTWVVSGRAIPGMRCSDWFVRISNRGGRLSGVVAVSQGNVPIHGMVLQPDGSFSGVTQAGHVNARAVRAYEVNGQFTGGLLSLTLENEICPVRSGSAMRSGG